MDYTVTNFIGSEANNEGWQKIEDKGIVELKNGEEKIHLEIEDEQIRIEINGSGSVVLLRGNKRAKFTKNALGKVEIGDKIWLLGPGAKEEIEGAAIKIETRDEKLETRDIFVSERSFFQERNNKKINLVLGLVVFGLLIAGTFFGYQKRSDSEQRKKFEEIKSSVEQKKVEIENVRNINIESALQLAQEAESVLNNAGKAEKKYSQELTVLRNEITEIKKSLGGENVEYEVAYDTNLISEGNGIFKGMVSKENMVYLWSQSLGQINLVDINLKSTEKIVSDERIKGWWGIFNSGDKWYGYDQNKIYEIKRNDLVETEIKGVTVMGEMTGWNGLIYALDNGGQNIAKINNGEAKNWFKEGTNLNEEANSISIDSSIWVLGKSGKIYRYNLGAEEKINMSFLPSLTKAGNLKTSEEVNFLAYVVDESIVVIYGKDGKILGKYNFGKIKINDIGIEKQNKAVLVLAENGKIYRIKIK